MKYFKLVLLMFSICFFLGCVKTSKYGNLKYMPENWLYTDSSDWQVRKLPEYNRLQLQNLKNKLAKERQGQYFNFFGIYKPEVLAEIDYTTSELDGAYLNLQYSSKTILSSLTPSMQGLSQTDPELEAGEAVGKNSNHRMFHDDMQRMFLLDQPSILSPMPVVGN